VRGMPFWATSLLTLLMCAYAGINYFTAKKPGLHAIGTAIPAPAQSGEEQLTAATPEDPGEVSVVGPLAVWMEAKNPQAKKKPATPWQAQPMDHIFADAEMPQKHLHAKFALNKSAQFRFVIPPHIITPKLEGSFRAFVKNGDGRPGRAADIDLVLMNAQQFDDFIHGRDFETSFVLESSEHAVEFALPGAHDQPQEYHLVFRDPALRANLFVVADFTVEAE
jgi:hypothetical protein